MVQLIVPKDHAVVSQRYDYQNEFQQNSEDYAEHWKWCLPFDTPYGKGTKPAPICFVWKTDVEDAVFQLSETPAFDAVVFSVSGCVSCEVYNLELDKTYYWRVGDSEVRSFRTDAAVPRWLKVDGTWNVRDTGGFKTMDGKRIKQGMLYRGAAFDADEAGDAPFVPNGLQTVRDVLKVRCDLDLRGAEQSDSGTVYKGSLLGEDVRFLQIACFSAAKFFDYPETCAKLMRVFADESNYPLYYHCAYGSDRTGILAIVLDVILGLSEEEVYTNYELSSVAFSDCPRSRHSESFQELEERIRPYGGSLHERIMTYLDICGVTKEEIERIRAILLED